MVCFPEILMEGLDLNIVGSFKDGWLLDGTSQVWGEALIGAQVLIIADLVLSVCPEIGA